MEMIKNILKPGHNVDNDMMYGSGISGKVQGEGSHFQESKSATAGTGPARPESENISNLASSNQLAATAGSTSGIASGSELSGPETKKEAALTSSNTHSHAVETTAGHGSSGMSGMPGTFESGNPYTAKLVDPRLRGTISDTHSGIPGNTTTGNTSQVGRDGGIRTAGSKLTEHERRKNDEITTATGPGASHTAGTGLGQSPTTAVGTHNSDVLNKADPRVDSDQLKTHGTSLGHGSTITAGPHSSTMINKADPTVDLDQSKTYGSTISGKSSATPAGPHSSNIQDKADPRVDSDHPKSQNSHLGRDAKALTDATAIGAGVHEHNKKENEPVGPYHGGPTGTAVPGPNSTATANKLDPRIQPGSKPTASAIASYPTSGGGAENTNIAHSTSLQSHASGGVPLSQEYREVQPAGVTTGTIDDSNHHHGRDAVVGTAAGGVAAHEYKKHEHETGVFATDSHYVHDDKNASARGTNSGYTSSSIVGGGPAPNTAGPHSKDWMNKLDPTVRSDPNAVPTGPASSYDTRAGVESGVAHRNMYNVPAARDTPGFVSSNVPPNTTHPVGTHNTSNKGHHLGRDAVTAGVIGAEVHKTDKHHDKHATGSNEPNQYENSTSTATSAPAGVQEPYQTESGVVDHSSSTTTGAKDKEHHYGRDTAVAGVVGGAAYEADKHHKPEEQDKLHEKAVEKEEKRAEREYELAKKEQKVAEKAAEKEQKRERKSTSGGLFGFLHRDKDKKYSKEDEAEFERQENEDNRHVGRNTAVGGGAAPDGTAVAVHGADKHRDHPDDYTGTDVPKSAEASVAMDKPLSTVPGTTAPTSNEGTHNIMDRSRADYMLPITDETISHNPLTSTKPVDTTSIDHHYGRDVTGVGAVGGAAALAGHEHEQQKHAGGERGATTGTGTSTNSSTGTRTTLGDHLHGEERNRGVSTTEGACLPTGRADHPLAHPAGEKGITTQGGPTSVAPHSSSLLNKLDPRVESLAGTGTMAGRNKLHKDPPAGRFATAATSDANADADALGYETGSYGTTGTGSGL